MTDDLVKQLRDQRYDGQLMMREQAAKRIEALEKALQFVCDELYAPEASCRCHLSAPCSDCVDYSSTREVLETARAALEGEK